jgi:hypothetical protein
MPEALGLIHRTTEMKKEKKEGRKKEGRTEGRKEERKKGEKNRKRKDIECRYFAYLYSQVMP